MDEFLTAKEVRDEYKISLSKLYQLANAGKIPVMFLDQSEKKKMVRFRRSAIEAWLKSKEVKPHLPK